jgi:hypothetical protein
LELHEAVDTLKHYYDKGFVDFDIEDHVADVAVLIDLVPRLLTQYDSLLETSYALTEGWEAYVKANPPTGLYLPGDR